MASNILSAKELHEIFTADGGLPAKGGQKDYCPDGSWLYKTKLHNFYEERKKLLKQERVRVLGSLIQAEWLPSEGRVKIEKQGKFSKSMGYAENGKHYLLPEEAMFLLDQGVIQIHHGGMPVSIQEAFTLFLLPPVSVDQYQVFAHFTRLGYILRRYTGPITYERQIGLRKCKKSSVYKRKMDTLRSVTGTDGSPDIALKKMKVAELSESNSKQEISDGLGNKECMREEAENMVVDKAGTETLHIDGTSMDTLCNTESLASKTSSSNIVNSNKSDKHSDRLEFVCMNCKEMSVAAEHTEMVKKVDICLKCRCCNGQDIECNPVTDGLDFNKPHNGSETHNQYSYTTRVDTNTDEEADAYTSVPYSTWDFKALDFPDISALQQTEEYRFTAKGDHFLPAGLTLSGRAYSVKRLQTLGRHRDKSLQFSHGATGVGSKLTAKNWSEYKLQITTTNEEEILLTSPVGHLWRGDVTPLIKPQQATSTRDILDRLKVIQNSQFSHTKQRLSQCTADRKLPEIVYDGYLPSSKFKKTKPGLPHFRLVITSQRSHVPDLYTLTSVNTESLQREVPVYWAVVECGEIIFFSFNDIDLPQDIAME